MELLNKIENAENVMKSNDIELNNNLEERRDLIGKLNNSEFLFEKLKDEFEFSKSQNFQFLSEEKNKFLALKIASEENQKSLENVINKLNLENLNLNNEKNENSEIQLLKENEKENENKLNELTRQFLIIQSELNYKCEEVDKLNVIQTENSTEISNLNSTILQINSEIENSKLVISELNTKLENDQVIVFNLQTELEKLNLTVKFSFSNLVFNSDITNFEFSFSEIGRAHV